MAVRIHPVILSGGAGTRLWPMSRTLRPKQLLPLISDDTMLQNTVKRVSGPDFAPPIVVCNDDHRFQVAEQLRAIGVVPQAILLEPVARNTAPAVAAAAAFLQSRTNDGGDDRTDTAVAGRPTVAAQDVMLVLPSDHHISDVDGFHRAIRTAVAAALQGAMVTFGITPSRPETGYGYIRSGAAVEGIEACFAVDRFVEKPDSKTAAAYVASGEYVWNSGVFLFPIAGALAELETTAPAIVTGCRAALAAANTDLDFVRLAAGPFGAIESISVDYALMERTTRGVVVPADIGWSDVGSWSALWELASHDDQGNATIGDVVLDDVAGCYVRAEHNLVAAIGVRDLVIVATDDVVLVVPRDRAQDVRDLVKRLETAGRTEHYIHTKVYRPWGWYQQIDYGSRFQVKQITVKAGHKLSLQMHHHRAEHWIVVSGTAKVTKGEEFFYLTEDQSTYIPHNTPHCLENPGRVPLRMIEVQSGGYLGEDDIVRFDDKYGRVAAD